MALIQRRLEEVNTDDDELQPNISSSDDEVAGVSSLARYCREALEVMIIQTFQRIIEPIILPVLTPLIHTIIKEQIGLAKQEILVSMKENLANKEIASVQKVLKLQFRSKICLPVYTGKPLLGENEKTIEIAMVDALSGQIVTTGPESMAKLEIVGFRIGDDESNDANWTSEKFQKMVINERKGKRTLQGNTCFQLKEGICFVDRISFTHSSENIKNGWYRLGAGVVDATLMNAVEVASTEAFLMKDGRAIYSEKHSHPSLSDKVCHLQQIRYKGPRYKHLEEAGVITVKDLLTLLYKDPKRLEDILDLKASSKIWDDIIKNAQASKGLFLYLDPSNETITGLVLDVKLQLKALIVEHHQYIPVNQLSGEQKANIHNLVKYASEHLDVLHSFEDEISLKEYVETGTDITSIPSSLTNDGPPSPCSQVIHASTDLNEHPNILNNSQMGQITNHAPTVTYRSERGKEIVRFDDEMIYFPHYYDEHTSYHRPNLESLNGPNFGTATEPNTSSQAVESLLETCGHMNTHDTFCQALEEFEDLRYILSFDHDFHLGNPYNEWPSNPANSDTDVVTLTARTVSACTIARTRWIKVFKLLRARKRWIKVSKWIRQNSLRKRISVSDGIEAHKKQRYC
uniref:calmodulin-binding protein 60 A-like n=1 Tax=Erigeron canadensis TaxID=72917 RepID=UPI001CB9BB3F|nr:calmodulin-binding protein 60 A-like [Erigeron canadensis]